MKNINDIVKYILESELLAQGTQAAVGGAKKVAKVGLATTVGIPAGLLGASKIASATGRDISNV